MLAFAKDITLAEPHHPEETQDAELKQYMDYQRKLNHKRLVYYALEHGMNLLKLVIKKARKTPETLDQLMETDFPNAHRCADPDTLKDMLKKLADGHSSTTQWYRMNLYFDGLVYDCVKSFLEHYNQILVDSPGRAEVYYLSEGEAIDFDDWVYLFFNNLDFHIGKAMTNAHYPFAKRNQAIEKEIEKAQKEGQSFKEALTGLQKEFQIDEVSIRMLLGQPAGDQDLEMLHTPLKNPIYDFLNEKQEGSWGAMDGESVMDQSYAMGAQLKVWVWKGKPGKRRGKF
ncbi:MAG: hypothetical protein ACE5EK_00750 [Nitrospinales bacterium]